MKSEGLSGRILEATGIAEASKAQQAETGALLAQAQHVVADLRKETQTLENAAEGKRKEMVQLFTKFETLRLEKDTEVRIKCVRFLQ
jgi:hypothetical protein